MAIAELNRAVRPNTPIDTDRRSPFTPNVPVFWTDVILTDAIEQLKAIVVAEPSETMRYAKGQEPDSKDWANAAVNSGAFDFWKSPGEDIYSEEDGEKA